MWRAFEVKSLAVQLSLPDDPVAVTGDPARLRQIMANLVDNAWKYTERGGAITISLLVEDREAVLRIEDTGLGISPDRLGSIFDLFTRGYPHATEAGLGVGLALVKRLVTLHGGRIEAASDGVGRGTIFVVRLPLAPHGPDEAIPETPRPVSARRILVIEDNDDAREALVAGLRLDGHMVEAAGTSGEGIEMAARLRPDVIILDIGLPDTDGYEVARIIRTKLGSGVRLVALTGYGQEADRRRAAEAGFDAHLTKPVSPEQLAAVIAEAAIIRHKGW
jgi:CheY-like chemotaxis protein/anti-sigma regulatory factor (Ser/Thr protein kinase)